MPSGLEALKTPPEGLFWSAPLESDSDFKKEDPLALDYLGQQVGLWLFRGFTTRTNRAQYYPVVLYGLHLADKAVHQYGYLGDDRTRIRLFERWERFWALATLESRSGQLERGNDDTMRGIRGATRAWFSGSSPLPLEFPLISRQSELGGLGAYLSSLREYGLVFPGSLRVTPAARDMIDSFWSEPRERNWGHLYEAYALQALRSDSPEIKRTSGRLTLAGLGERSRLSALIRCGRTEQQERLWQALFVAARDDSTRLLAERLITAHRDGVVDPEVLLEGLLDGRWGHLPPHLVTKVEVALAFGRVARELLRRFGRAYGFVGRHDWIAHFDTVAKASFPDDETLELRNLCRAMLSAHDAQRFSKLPYHGPALLTLLRHLTTSGAIDSLNYLLEFHQRVQRSRRGGGAWLRVHQGKLVMQVTGYSGPESEADFPGFKFNVVLRLLADLGKLA